MFIETEKRPCSIVLKSKRVKTLLFDNETMNEDMYIHSMKYFAAVGNYVVELP